MSDATTENEQSAIEFEENVNKKAFTSILGELVNALGKGNLDIHFSVGDKEVSIPASVLKNAEFEVEYEEEDDECELELSIGWKK